MRFGAHLALYDKVYRKDVLTFAYACCKANGGAAGVDNQMFEDIEAYGVERWLEEMTQELKSRFRRTKVARTWSSTALGTSLLTSGRLTLVTGLAMLPSELSRRNS